MANPKSIISLLLFLTLCSVAAPKKTLAANLPKSHVPTTTSARASRHWTKKDARELDNNQKVLNVSGGGGGDGPIGIKTMSIPQGVFNLVKAIVGVGVLGLPAGVAAFANEPSALIPGLSLVAIIGILSAYTFSLLGRVCALTSSRTYREAWSKTVGTRTSWIPAASSSLKTFAGVISFSMVLADTFTALFATAGVTVSRLNTLLGLTVGVLLPLCLIKDLSSLAPFSIVGIFGMLYTLVAMGISFIGGGYVKPEGRFLVDLDEKFHPSFGDKGAMAVFDPRSMILVCMLSTAYIAHANAPKFYLELENNTIPRFNAVVWTSFAVSIVLMGLITAVGFLTFGASCSGLVLNNYSKSDSWMSLSRVAVSLSLLFSYPLLFVACRDGLLDSINFPWEKRTNDVINKLTIGLLIIVTTLASQLKDLSFVLSFGGATLGNALIYVYPALILYFAAKKEIGDDVQALKRESLFAGTVAIMGIVVGCIGAKMALDKL